MAGLIEKLISVVKMENMAIMARNKDSSKIRLIFYERYSLIHDALSLSVMDYF